jgi:hypothetical protein
MLKQDPYFYGEMRAGSVSSLVEKAIGDGSEQHAPSS